MGNIFVIDKANKEIIGMIDFLPKKEERILLRKLTKTLECKVCCVVYHPSENGTLIFVDVVEPYYSKMVSEIKW